MGIHPGYEHLREWIGNLPGEDPNTFKVIRNHRNTLFKATVDRKMYVVKRFKRPNPFNRIVYSFLRRSKARRAYEYAERLLDRGIETAAPVAWIEIRKKGLFHTGYFVSEYLSDPLLEEVENHYDRDRILDDFARFTAGLHLRGIVHGDYNVGNILFRQQNGKYRFAVIDNNRIRFRKPSRQGCVNELKRTGLPTPSLVRVADQYALIRGWNPDIFCGKILLRRGLDIKGRLKKEFKSQIHQISLFWEEHFNYAHR